MNPKIELLIRKTVLKDVEIWLYKQYVEIDNELRALDAAEQNNDESS